MSTLFKKIYENERKNKVKNKQFAPYAKRKYLAMPQKKLLRSEDENIVLFLSSK